MVKHVLMTAKTPLFHGFDPPPTNRKVYEGLQSENLKYPTWFYESFLTLSLKGQLQSHTTMLAARQERGERGKWTLPAFTAHLLNILAALPALRLTIKVAYRALRHRRP